MKRPSFQFYPADWRNHFGLRSCSPAARSMWIDMMCLMHNGDPYGYLKVGSKVIPKDTLKVMLGFTLEEMEGYLAELKTADVYQLDEEGCIYSPRMIRDESIRVIRSAGGVKGGSPALKQRTVNLNGNLAPNLPGNLGPNLDTNQKATSSSSSSSSSSTKEINKESPAEPTPAEKLRARIRSWFGQKEDKIWDDKEKKAFSKVLKLKTTPEEIDILEAYYTADIPPDQDYRRSDPVTLMNNWNGEIVRGTDWQNGLLNFRAPNGSHNGTTNGNLKIKILEDQIQELKAEAVYDSTRTPEKLALLKTKREQLATLKEQVL